MIGELDFRYMPHKRRLEYEVDEQLLWRLKANQNGFEWLAQMSQKSSTIRINNLGFRGDDIDINTMTGLRILAVGSSSTLGTGVSENQVWHRLLQDQLNANGYRVSILNGANPGWGPFQHATFIEQQFGIINPDLMVVFASVGDLNFKPFKTEQEKQTYLENSKKRKALLAISPFATYTLRKAESFIKPTINQINNFTQIFQAEENNEQTKAKKHAAYLAHSVYWLQMIHFANVKNTPLIFYVPNLEGNEANLALYEHLKEISNEVSNVKVAYLGSDNTDIHKLKNTYLIQNDGHPNASYHAQIANGLLKHIKSQI